MRRFLSVIFALLLFLSACSREIPPASPTPPAESRTIIHAGGIVWGRAEDGSYRAFTGTNSLEGLTQSADQGAAVIELDFSFTADGKLVCAHDWNGWSHVPTLAEFEQTKIHGSFTPMTMETVSDFLHNHPDVTIVTDIKENFPEAVRQIAEMNLPDHFIVQIYQESEYEIAQEYGFGQVIYTLYRLDWQSKTDTKTIADFAEDHPLYAVAFDKELCENADFVEQMQSIGVPLFVHTVNENEEWYYNQGLGIYTDKTNSP